MPSLYSFKKKVRILDIGEKQLFSFGWAQNDSWIRDFTLLCEFILENSSIAHKDSRTQLFDDALEPSLIFQKTSQGKIKKKTFYWLSNIRIKKLVHYQYFNTELLLNETSHRQLVTWKQISYESIMLLTDKWKSFVRHSMANFPSKNNYVSIFNCEEIQLQIHLMWWKRWHWQYLLGK